MAEQLLKFVKKSHGIQTLNLNQEDTDQQLFTPGQHYLLIATPGYFARFIKHSKVALSHFKALAFDDLDYMFSFGFKADLDSIQFLFRGQLAGMLVLLAATSSEQSTEFEDFKEKVAPSALSVKSDDCLDAAELGLQEDEEAETAACAAVQRHHQQVMHYYSLGDQVNTFILLYILFKL